MTVKVCLIWFKN